MFGELGRMMKLAAEIKTRLPEIQAKLAAAEFTAEAGGGAVRVTVNGKLALVDVKIDPKLLSDARAGAEAIADLVKSAVAAAQDRAVKAAKEMMKELTGGMDIPGLGGLT
jgi:hypothetical protein